MIKSILCSIGCHSWGNWEWTQTSHTRTCKYCEKADHGDHLFSMCNMTGVYSIPKGKQQPKVVTEVCRCGYTIIQEAVEMN